MKEVKAIMFKNRHQHEEIDGLPEIFPDAVDPMDFESLDKMAYHFFDTNPAAKYIIYVTGLTPATIAVIKAAIRGKAALVLMNYNRDTNAYVAYPVVSPVLEEQDQAEFGVWVPAAWNKP